MKILPGESDGTDIILDNFSKLCDGCDFDRAGVDRLAVSVPPSIG
jgi:hypothetical protein